MGPRSFDRGIARQPRHGPQHGLASMGPRSFDRGIMPRVPPSALYLWLQWGRDRLIAEFGHSGWGAPGGSGLQWGRDRLIAELWHNNMALDYDPRASMGPRSF